MNKHRGDRLADLMHAVDADNLPHLHSLTIGLRRDLDAVTNGLTLTHSSGPVEATSTGSRPSSGRCMAGPAFNCCESGSSSPHESPQDHRQNRIT
jgi:transposase